jgi:hypothetical protein
MSKYDKYVEMSFILFIIVLGFFYVYLASNTQMLGEDEGGYVKQAKDFASMTYPADPYGYVPSPLMPLFYSISFLAFGYSLGAAKAVVALMGMLTLLMVYLFCKRVDKTSFLGVNAFGLASVSILLTITYFTHFMLIAYTEIPIALFSILIVYVLMDMKDTKSAVLVGSIMGISYYVRNTTPLIFPAALIIFALVRYFTKKDKQFLKLSFIACLVAAALIAPFVLRNIALFNFPYIEGLNSFFKPNVTLFPAWETSDIIKSLSISTNFFDVFGYIALFLGIFGIVYLLQEKNEKMFFMTSLLALFLLVFFIRTALGTGIGDPRYFSVVFPEVALIGGYFISKVSAVRKYLPLILVMFFVYSVITSASIAVSTQQSQRYPSNYVDALNWLKQNTAPSNLIFTAYGGSVNYFAGRNSIWASNMNDFPDIMHSTNSTYIYDRLKSYNVSYILVWRGVLSSDWIIPQSNLIGVFTYNFVTQVDNDKTHFNATYSNQDNFIYKLL